MRTQLTKLEERLIATMAHMQIPKASCLIIMSGLQTEEQQKAMFGYMMLQRKRTGDYPNEQQTIQALNTILDRLPSPETAEV